MHFHIHGSYSHALLPTYFHIPCHIDTNTLPYIPPLSHLLTIFYVILPLPTVTRHHGAHCSCGQSQPSPTKLWRWGWRGWIVANQNNHRQTMVSPHPCIQTLISSLVLSHTCFRDTLPYHLPLLIHTIKSNNDNRLKQQVGSDLSQASLFVKLIPINSFEDEGEIVTYTLIIYTDGFIHLSTSRIP